MIKMNKEKIIIKKFKKNYNGYWYLSTWIFILFLITCSIRVQVVKIIKANIISQLDLLSFLLGVTAIFLIILKYKLKHEPDNYTNIEIEGKVKCQKY